MGDPKWSCWRLPTQIHKRSFGLPALREVPVALDCLAVPHLPAPYHFGGLRGLAVPRFGIFHGRYGSLLHLWRVLSPGQEILRGLWDARRCFNSSHQDQWWLSCACALHFLALQLFHSDVTIIINHKFLVLIILHPLSLSFPSPSFPRSPRHEYTLNDSRPSQLYFHQCHLVTGIYPITPRRCLYCWLLSSLPPSTCEYLWSQCISLFFI